MSSSPTTQLWLPNSARQEFRKAPPPKLGPAFGNWSGDVEMAYVNLPGGAMLQFDLSRLTLADYRTMRWHYQINISLSILAFTLHQLDWRIECEDQRIQSFLEENWSEVWTRFIRGIFQAFWAGFSPMAIEYENDLGSGRIKISKFKDLVPEHCTVNWKKVDGWAPQGQVKPKRYLYDGIKQFGTTNPIPPENTFWYPVLMENGDYYGRKLLKAAFPAWFFSQIIHLFANRYFERFGEPLPIGRAPWDDEQVDADGRMVSGREVMERILAGIRSRSSVVLPASRNRGSGDKDDFEYTIDYLESQMRGADFERYLKRLDEEMSLAMFMPVLLFRTADIGSYNLGQAHERMFMWHMNALAGDLAEYIDRYALNRLVDFNFSPNAPRAHFTFRKLGKDRDETLRAIINAAIQQELIRPDVEELGTALGLKIHEIRQVVGEDGELDPALAPKGLGKDAKKKIVNEIDQSEAVATQAIKRFAGQLEKAFGRDDVVLRPELGYRRKFEHALMMDGYDAERAAKATTRIYGRVERFLDEVLSIGWDAYSSPQEIIELLGRAFHGEIEDALA